MPTRTTDGRTARCGTRCEWETLTTALETCSYEGVPVGGIRSSGDFTFVLRTDGAVIKFDRASGLEVARQVHPTAQHSAA